MLLSILSVLTAVSICVLPAFGQQTCQTEILHNSTVDIDKYLNKELHILAKFNTSLPEALSNCVLQCCNQSNCSLAIHNASDNNMCTLIHCVSEDACQPIPSDGSEMVKTLENNITTTEGLSEGQSKSTESSFGASTTASGISLLTTSRGDRSTSSQQSTTQDYNDFFASNTGYSTTPITETSESTNEVLPTTFSVSTNSVPSSLDQTSTTENTSLQNTSAANTTNPNSIFGSTTPSNSTPDLFTSSNSSNMTATNPEGTTTNYNNFTKTFNTTTTTTLLINNETETLNHTIMYVTPSLPENGNISITDHENVTFSHSNDTENSTLDDSTESFYATTATFTKNESDILNYTTTYSYPNSSSNEYMSVTVDENATFSQITNTVNSTIDSNFDRNATTSKQETNLKNKADSNNTLMIAVLIGTLSVGTLLFVAVIVVISKRIIDGWQKRHYSRIDYLVNGMYN